MNQYDYREFIIKYNFRKHYGSNMRCATDIDQTDLQWTREAALKGKLSSTGNKQVQSGISFLKLAAQKPGRASGHKCRQALNSAPGEILSREKEPSVPQGTYVCINEYALQQYPHVQIVTLSVSVTAQIQLGL